MANGMRPLDGLVVLDITQALSGPICSCILADYGATVIKVEGTGKPDMTRGKNYDPNVPLNIEVGGDNFYAINRNKLGICVNNRSPEGQHVLQELAKTADIVVSNFRPGVTQKIGIDYDTLSKINPRIITCEISAFREAERVNDPAFDVVIQAASGILASTGYPNEAPAKVGASICDMSAGLNAVQGILMALLVREKTGKGQNVSVRMQDAAMFMLAQYATPCISVEGFDLQRSGMCHVEATPSNGYKTTDGYILIAPASDKLFVQFAELVGHPEMATDPRFCDGAARFKHRQELDEVIAPIMASKTSDEWYRIMKAAGLPASPISTPRQAFQKAYAEGSPIVATVQHPLRGDMPVIGTVVDLSETPGRVDGKAPAVGENTRDILKSMGGFTDAEIDELEAKGAVKCFKGLDK